MARLDTTLESEGAEFLVLGQLLLHRIAAYKTYTKMPGYDVVATDPKANTSAKIQVKSRWITKANGFIINNFNCDFVVVVRLNRGKRHGGGEVRDPDYYVFPVLVLSDLHSPQSWGKIAFNQINNMESYRDKWSLIVDFLSRPIAVAS